MNLLIDEEERELLIDLLQRHIGETRVEIRHTFDHDFKGRLQREEVVSKSLMEKIGKQAAAA
jgi:hypothetical protein